MRDREGTIMARLDSGEFEEARRIIDAAHATDPSLQLPAPSRIGPFFEKVFSWGDHARTIDVCKVWALADPGAAGPYFSMARVYKAWGRTEEARDCCRKIIEMDPRGRSAESARRALEQMSGGR